MELNNLFVLLNHFLFFIFLRKLYTKFIKDGLSDFFYEHYYNYNLENRYKEKRDALEKSITILEDFKNSSNKDLLKIKDIERMYQAIHNKKQLHISCANDLHEKNINKTLTLKKNIETIEKLFQKAIEEQNDYRG